MRNISRKFISAIAIHLSSSCFAFFFALDMRFWRCSKFSVGLIRWPKATRIAFRRLVSCALNVWTKLCEECANAQITVYRMCAPHALGSSLATRLPPLLVFLLVCLSSSVCFWTFNFWYNVICKFLNFWLICIPRNDVSLGMSVNNFKWQVLDYIYSWGMCDSAGSQYVRPVGKFYKGLIKSTWDLMVNVWWFRSCLYDTRAKANGQITHEHEGLLPGCLKKRSHEHVIEQENKHFVISILVHISFDLISFLFWILLFFVETSIACDIRNLDV